MGSRGPPYEGRATHTPGMMRHGPYPAGSGQPLEPLPHPDLLENKIASQATEIDRLLRENQRLAATNVAMRKEISANQQEMQRIKSHIGSIHTESDIQVRGLLEKIRKVETDIRAGESVKEELQKAHKEAKDLVAIRQELSREHQILSEELIKAGVDGQRIPELLAEFERLKQEHQKLRIAFEHEKSSNIEQANQMRGMERNLISLAREVEKLRADVINAEKGDHAANPYPVSYGNPTPSYSLAGYGLGYGHGHVVSNSNVGGVHGLSTNYAQQPYGYSMHPALDGSMQQPQARDFLN